MAGVRVSTAIISKTSLDSMLRQQSKLNRTQLQVSTGRSILAPSDNPYGSTRALDLKEVVSVYDQYQVNATFATNRLNLEEGVLEGSGNAIQRIRELALQGNNDSQTMESRKSIAQEISLLLDQLGSLSNSTDSNNEYLFAGYKGRTKPFVKNAAGQYQYFGDDGQRYLKVGSATDVAVGDSGYDVFLAIRNGNGKFQTAENVANTGTGIIDPGTVNGAYVPNNYKVTFIPSSNLADPYAPVEYYVTEDDAVLGPVIVEPSGFAGSTEAAYLLSGPPVVGLPYEDGAVIAGLDARGIQLDITGEPKAGDTFAVTPSTHQDLFTTVQNLVTALTSNQSDFVERSHFHNAMNRAISDIDQAMGNILDTRSRVGARLNTVDKQTNINESFNLELKKNLSSIVDLDYASAITTLNQQLMGLQAAQQTYTKVQGLSMFNYI